MQREVENGLSQYKKTRALVFNANIDTVLRQMSKGSEVADIIELVQESYSEVQMTSNDFQESQLKNHSQMLEVLTQAYQEALMAPTVAERFSHSYKVEWDKADYLRYVDSYTELEFEILANEATERPDLMGMVAGLNETINCLQELKTLLGEYNNLLEPYEHPVQQRQFHTDNVRSLQKMISETLKAMVGRLALDLNSPHVDKAELVDAEFKIFSRFFASKLSVSDQRFVARRLGLSEDQAMSIHEIHSDVLTTEYTKTYKSFDVEQRRKYARIFACRFYLEYLEGLIEYMKLNFGLVPEAPVLDDRIRLQSEVLDYVKNCFSLLNLDKNGGRLLEPVMTKDDIDYLIQSNFLSDTEVPIPRKLLNVKTNKGNLAFFMGNVFLKILPFRSPEQIISLEDLTNFLRDNFKDRAGQSNDTIQSAIRTKPKNFEGKLSVAISDYYKDLKRELSK